jgi:hypothetical protein
MHGTGTVLIYFVELDPEILHKSKEMNNTPTNYKPRLASY